MWCLFHICKENDGMSIVVGSRIHPFLGEDEPRNNRLNGDRIGYLATNKTLFHGMRTEHASAEDD